MAAHGLTAVAEQRAPTPDGIKVIFGQLQSCADQAIWLPNRTDAVTHFNVGITGTMGSGKTQFTKSLLTQIVRQAANNPGGRRPGMLIFDYKGDYVDTQPGGFAHAVGARVLAPHQLPINPLRLKAPESKLDLKLAMRQFAETVKTIATATGDVQRLGIIQAIEGCLRDAGIDEDAPGTWRNPFPTLKDLHARIARTGEVDGVPFAVLHDLADFDIFAPVDPGVELDAFFDEVTVIDLRPLAGAEKVIRAVIAFFMNAFFARMIQQGESLRETRSLPSGGKADVRQLRRLLLVDEADDFIGLNLSSLKNVMQQGRAFGYGVILSTQFLHHFDSAANPLKPLIGTWVMHRMAGVGAASLRNLFSLSNDDARALANTLSGLEVHASVCFGLSNDGARRRLARVRDLPFFELPPA
jgi:DNA phosphorothioation-dependent restriction protein DptH